MNPSSHYVQAIFTANKQTYNYSSVAQVSEKLQLTPNQLAADHGVSFHHLAGIIGAFMNYGRVKRGPFAGVHYIGWTEPT